MCQEESRPPMKTHSPYPHRLIVAAFLMAMVSLLANGCGFQETTKSKKTTKRSTGPGGFPAFPGAEGPGRFATGGRGGKVLFVTTTNPDGQGSLKAALESSGSRVVIFRTGGLIDWTSVGGKVALKDGDITIAGQTAPGDGIAIKNGFLNIQASNVIIRGLRFRVGDLPGYDPDMRDGMDVWPRKGTSSQGIIIDHCSVAWAIDVGIDIGNQSRDVTVQWCLIGEGLFNSIHPTGEHSKGLAFHKTGTGTYAVHHTLFAHNTARNPQVMVDGEVINNVIYNFGQKGTNVGPDVQAHVIGNYYKPGPSTKARKGLNVTMKGPATGGPKIYALGNVGPGKSEQDSNEWDISDADSRYYSSGPVISETSITIHQAQGAYELVLEYAGAITPHRDPVDTRMVNDVKNGTGRIINSQTEVGGWPKYSSGTPPADSDNDGLPDDWEKVNGTNPSAADDDGDVDKDGYTNIEEYINGLIPMPG